MAAPARPRPQPHPTPPAPHVHGTPTGPGVTPDSGLASIALLAARPPAARLDVAPFYALYAVALVGTARGMLARPPDAPRPLLPAHFPLILVGALHAFLYLACHWSVGVAAAVRFVRVGSVGSATHVRVTPGAFGGGPEIVALAARPSFDRGGALEPVFDYRRARFVWVPSSAAPAAAAGGNGGAPTTTTTSSSASSGAFAPLPYPDSATLATYAKAAGVGTRAPAALAAWGPNAISVPVPAFSALLADQLRAPFFVFQLFCVGLWCLDEYWYYSLFTLAMLVMFESTVAGQRLKNLRDLRGLQAAKPRVLVKRCGAWTAIPGEGVVPGDLISVGAPPPAVEGPYVRPAAGRGAARATNGAAAAAAAAAAGADPAHAGADDAAVPADALLLAGTVVVEEAVLTGESAPQWKAPLYESAAAAAAAAAADGPGGGGGQGGQAAAAAAAAFAEVANADLSARLDAKRHKAHILFGGTSILQHAPDPGAHDPPPDGGCLALVLRTGYETAQGRLMRTILHAHAGDRVTANSWEAGAFICLLLVFALAAAGYVLAAGLADPGRDRFKLYLNCVMIVTSVVPPELPMELTIAVNASLVALARAAIWCTEPFRIPLAGGVHVACFDKTGTLTSDEMVLEGVAVADGCGGGGGGSVSASALTPARDAPLPARRVLAACHSLVSAPSGLAGDPLERAAFAATGWEVVGDGKVRSPRGERRGGGGGGGGGGAAPRLTLTILRRHHFSAALRRMAVVVAPDDGSPCLALVKGAPEAVAGLLADVPPGYGRAAAAFAARGGRVIALAWKPLLADGGGGGGASLTHGAARALPRAAVEAGLTFAGFAVLGCPLQPESAAACAALAASGHALVMITGDAPLTACHVAGELGITTRPVLILSRKGGGGGGGGGEEADGGGGGAADPGDAGFEWRPRPSEGAPPPPAASPSRPLPYAPPGAPGSASDLATTYDLCVTGDGLAHAVAAGHDGDLVPRVSVWARTAPDQKEHVLRLLRSAGAGTLMCGDGTNDVGALKAAHVGVALLASRPAPPPSRAGAGGRPASHALDAAAPPPPPPPLRAGGRMLAEARAAGRPVDARMERLAAWLDRMDASANPGQGGGGGGADAGDGPPIVRPGDASAAAPFTARAGGPGAVVAIIRQGRATLVTTVQMFKILGLLSLGAAYALSVQYLQGVKLGDGQATVAGLASAALFFMLSQAKPAPVLAAARPHASVFCGYALASLAGQFASHLALLAWSYSRAAAGMAAAAAAGGAAAAAAGLDPAALAAAVAEDAASAGVDVAAALNATLTAAGVNASAALGGGGGGAWGLAADAVAGNGTAAAANATAAVAAAAAALTPTLALAAARAPDAAFTPNLVNTVCYYVTLHLQLATFAANYQGAPFCTPMAQAGALRGVLLYGSLAVAAGVLGFLPPLAAALKLTPVPWPLAPQLVAAFAANYGFCYAWERAMRAALPARPPQIGPGGRREGVGGQERRQTRRRKED